MSKPKGSAKLTSILFVSTNCSSRREERSIEKWKKKHFQVLAHQTTQENTHEEREREREREKLPDVMTGGSR
jgi:hypothetical protein